MDTKLKVHPRFSKGWRLLPEPVVNVQTRHGVVQMPLSEATKHFNGKRDEDNWWMKKIKQLIALLFNRPTPSH